MRGSLGSPHRRAHGLFPNPGVDFSRSAVRSPSVTTTSSSFRDQSPLQSSFARSPRSGPFGHDHRAQWSLSLHLLRFSSLVATSHARSHFSRDFPGPATFRPQAFAASRRFAPHTCLRACFIPLPRPGLCLFRGFSPRAATLPRRKEPAPLPLFHRRFTRLLPLSQKPTRSHVRCLSASRPLSAQGRVLRVRLFTSPVPAPLLSFLSPGPSFLRRQRRFTRHFPLMMLPSFRSSRAPLRLSAAGLAKLASTLRPPRLRNFVTPFDAPSLQLRSPFGARSPEPRPLQLAFTFRRPPL